MVEKHPVIEVIETKKTDLNGYTLIEGFPGMGLVGTISAKYLVEKLEFEQIGYIESNVFIPVIRIHNGLPINPSRIYVNNKRKLVVLISEQIIPQHLTEKLAKTVVEWIGKKKIGKVISLTGINAGVEQKQKIYGIAANEKSKQQLDKYGVEIIDEGITTGITALILLGLKEKNANAISFLGNVTIQADYKASAAIIQKLNEVLGLKLDVNPLLKEAKETEKILLKNIKQVKETHEEVKKMEDQTPMYT